MKTTIDLPDALYRRAKIRAAERGTTLRALLTESLEAHLLEQQSRVPSFRNGTGSAPMSAAGRFCSAQPATAE